MFVLKVGLVKALKWGGNIEVTVEGGEEVRVMEKVPHTLEKRIIREVLEMIDKWGYGDGMD